MVDFYINIRCKKCGRFVGTVLQARQGDAKTVGCKMCRITTDITLKDGQVLYIGDLEIHTGYSYCYDS